MAEHPVGRFWLAVPWILLACGIPLAGWWLLEPVPLTITYAAPSFLSAPAATREEAVKLYVSEVPGGSVVWRYVEWCVARPFEATSHRSWVGRAIVWPAPDVPTTLSRTTGCFSGSFPVETPTSNPTRRFEFIQRIEVQMNPMRTELVYYAPLALTLLSPQDCKK